MPYHTPPQDRKLILGPGTPPGFRLPEIHVTFDDIKVDNRSGKTLTVEHDGKYTDVAPDTPVHFKSRRRRFLFWLRRWAVVTLAVLAIAACGVAAGKTGPPGPQGPQGPPGPAAEPNPVPTHVHEHDHCEGEPPHEHEHAHDHHHHPIECPAEPEQPTDPTDPTEPAAGPADEPDPGPDDEPEDEPEDEPDPDPQSPQTPAAPGNTDAECGGMGKRQHSHTHLSYADRGDNSPPVDNHDHVHEHCFDGGDGSAGGSPDNDHDHH